MLFTGTRAVEEHIPAINGVHIDSAHYLRLHRITGKGERGSFNETQNDNDLSLLIECTRAAEHAMNYL